MESPEPQLAAQIGLFLQTLLLMGAALASLVSRAIACVAVLYLLLSLIHIYCKSGIGQRRPLVGHLQLHLVLCGPLECRVLRYALQMCIRDRASAAQSSSERMRVYLNFIVVSSLSGAAAGPQHFKTCLLYTSRCV